MVVLTVFILSSFIWGLCALGQFTRKTKRFQIAVPIWMSRLCGSRTSNVDVGLFSAQIFSALLFIWSIPVSIIYSQGSYRGFVFWRGAAILFFVSLGLFAFLIYLSKKK